MARGSVKTLGPGRHKLRWDEPKGPNGKRQQREKVFHGTKKAADAHLAELMTKAQNPPSFTPSERSVREVFQEFLAEREGKDLRPGTAKLYRALFNNDLEPLCGDLPLADVTRVSMQNVINRMVDRGLMPSTVVTRHGCLMGFFRWTVEKAGYLSQSPVRGLTLPEVIIDGPYGRVLNSDECTEVLKLLEGTPLWIIVFLGLYTGLRIGELLGLSEDHLDLESDPDGGALLSVNRTLDYLAPFPQFGPPKTRTSNRVVWADPDVRNVLLARREAAPSVYHSNGRQQSFRQVCVRSDGQLISIDAAESLIVELLAGTPFADFRLHGMRHTHATILLVDGESMLVVSKRLGHANIQTTVDRYGHLLPTSDPEAGRRFGSLMRAANPEGFVGNLWG